MNPEEFAKAADVSRETLTQLVVYKELLEKWGARINLVGRDTLVDAWQRHFLDSAQLRKLLPRGRRVLYDLGSGAGFPGLVLAILDPKLEVHLVESDKRKAAFLAEVARATGRARQVTIHARRVASLPEGARGTAEIVTARALAELGELLALAAPLLAPGAVCLFLKGAQAERELTLAAKHWKMRVERLASRTDPAGLILRISDLARIG